MTKTRLPSVVGVSSRASRSVSHAYCPFVVSEVSTGEHRVYNLEVETEHCFLAGQLGVLSHNETPCAKKRRLAERKAKKKAQRDARKKNAKEGRKPRFHYDKSSKNRRAAYEKAKAKGERAGAHVR